MEKANIARAARITRDDAGNPVAIVPLPVWEALLEEIGAAAEPAAESTLADLSPLSVGAWPDGLQLLGRDEYYGDDGR